MNAQLLLVAAGLAAVCAGPPSAKFPKCDKDVIKNIEAYWEGAGTPKAVLDLKGQYVAYKSTDGDVFKRAKCRIYEFLGGNKVKATVDGVEETIELTEKDGVLISLTKKTYVISSDEGAIGTYMCSDAERIRRC